VPGHRKPLHLQDHPLPGRGGLGGRGHAPAHHQADEGVLVGLFPPKLPHLFPAPKDGDAVGDGQDLVQLVADEDDGEAPGLEPPDLLEEVLGLLGGEDAGGLVQDQDPGPVEEGPQKLHPLLLPGGEAVDGRLQVHPQRVLGEKPPQAPKEAPAAEKGRQVQAQGQVLRHAVGLYELGVLGHQGDAQALGRPGRGDAHLLALQEDPPLVGGVEAVEDADQGGLPGPILPEEGQDLSPAHLEAHPPVGHHGTEALGDLLQPQHGTAQPGPG
jgi:hypothetical protein